MTEDRAVGAGVEAREIRLLEGPNLYFPRAALKVRLGMGAWAELPAATVARACRAVGMPVRRAGEPGSSARSQVLARLAGRVLRELALASGVKRLAVRARIGGSPDEVVVAAPWRHRGRARAIGEALGPLLDAVLAAAPDVAAGMSSAAGDAAQRCRDAIEDAARTVREAPLGSAPTAITPTVPVVSITGTNGKTTTTRLVAHMAMTAGLTTAWSSTDGVVVMGAMVEPGDYSGPAGARAVLETPGLDMGILETARGGMLLKGMGVTRNDVSVVTNVSADHLGLQGIDTVDQLAEVKAIVTTVTRADGWVDPRTWAMRTRAAARPWAFSLDPASPALREARNAGGRAMTVIDEQVSAISASGDVDPLVPVVEIPVTLAGLATHNVANVLAATAAGLALGLPRSAVVSALRSFLPDPVLSAGRLNSYDLPLAEGGSATVIVDLAHNEAGLAALLDVAVGLRRSGGSVHLGLGTAGDRGDDILVRLGELAGTRADHVVIAHKEHYLRGRTTEEMTALFAEGLRHVGMGAVASYPTEQTALAALVEGADDGDVVAMMCHAERAELDAWLTGAGATIDGPEEIRAKVARAQAAAPIVGTGRAIVLLGAAEPLGRALAETGTRTAVVDVSAMSQAVVRGAALKEGAERRAQARLAVDSACEVARRLLAAGFDVVVCDPMALDPSRYAVHLAGAPVVTVSRVAASHHLGLPALTATGAERITALVERWRG
jgi:cyanophycin synthetase